MSKCELIPQDSLTQQILIDILTAMYKNRNTVAKSELTKIEAARTGLETVESNPTETSSTDATSGKGDDHEFGSLAILNV